MRNSLYFGLGLSLIILSGCVSIKTESKWLKGNWSGQGYQPGAQSQESWSIEFSYNGNDETLKVEYPSLNCGGEWKIISAEKNLVVMKEVLSFGFNNCLNGGKVIATKTDENYISLAFYHPDHEENVIAIGLLWQKN